MSDAYIPSNPQSVAVRPLNVGMVDSVPSVGAKQESFRIIDGFDVTERGLRKHGGWAPFFRSAGFSAPLPTMFDDQQVDTTRRLGERIEDMFFMWVADGTTRICVVTNRLMYTLDLSTGYKPIYWGRQYAVLTYNGAGANGVINTNGNYITPDLLAADDWIELVDGGTTKWFKVASVTAPNTITLVGKPTNNMTVGQTFKILKPMQADGDLYVDFTIGRSKAYLVDSYSPMVFQYDGTWMSPLLITNAGGTRNIYGARTISFYKERLYFGNIAETAGSTVVGTQRIRWTEVLDWTKSADGNYQDLSFRQGPVQKLLGFGDMLVAYMTDAVYYGRQTNLTTLPYAFYLLETAGIAPLGMKAICSFIDGQIFVGADDVYYLSSGPKIEPIGAQIANLMLTGITNPGGTRIRPDILNSRVVIGISKTTETYDEMYFWNYKSHGWSRALEPALTMFAALSATDQLYIEELNQSETFASSVYTSTPIGSLMAKQGALNLFGFVSSKHLMQYDPLAVKTTIPLIATEVNRPVYGCLITQDFEFDLPDDTKTVFKLTVRVGDLQPNRTENIRFSLEGSTNAGRSWRYLGTMNIAPGDDEDSLNFRLTGSTITFRLITGEDGSTSGTTPTQFEVVAYTMRVRKRGSEYQRGTTRP